MKNVRPKGFYAGASHPKPTSSQWLGRFRRSSNTNAQASDRQVQKRIASPCPDNLALLTTTRLENACYQLKLFISGNEEVSFGPGNVNHTRLNSFFKRIYLNASSLIRAVKQLVFAVNEVWSVSYRRYFGRKLITASTCGSGTDSDWPMTFARALVNGRDVGLHRRAERRQSQDEPTTPKTAVGVRSPAREPARRTTQPSPGINNGK